MYTHSSSLTLCFTHEGLFKMFDVSDMGNWKKLHEQAHGEYTAEEIMFGMPSEDVVLKVLLECNASVPNVARPLAKAAFVVQGQSCGGMLTLCIAPRMR
jgi:hypothetical protein